VGTNSALAPADRPTRAARWGVSAVAAVYVAYLALLITCDLWRVSPLGFVPRFESGAVAIDRVDAGSSAAARGLRAGDVIARANGRRMEGPADWQRLRVHLDPPRPLDLEIARAEGTLAVSLPPSTGRASASTRIPRQPASWPASSAGRRARARTRWPATSSPA